MKATCKHWIAVKDALKPHHYTFFGLNLREDGTFGVNYGCTAHGTVADLIAAGAEYIAEVEHPTRFGTPSVIYEARK